MRIFGNRYWIHCMPYRTRITVNQISCISIAWFLAAGIYHLHLDTFYLFKFHNGTNILIVLIPCFHSTSITQRNRFCIFLYLFTTVNRIAEYSVFLCRRQFYHPGRSTCDRQRNISGRSNISNSCQIRTNSRTDNKAHIMMTGKYPVLNKRATLTAAITT